MTTEPKELLALAEELPYLQEYDGSDPAYVQRKLECASSTIRDLSAKLEAERRALEACYCALDFAAGAIGDAIYTEDGLDGDSGQRVLHIITEAREKGTFDKAKYGDLDSLCPFERADAAESMLTKANALADSATHQVELLESRLAAVFERTRERCAKVCEILGAKWLGHLGRVQGNNECAEAIRALALEESAATQIRSPNMTVAESVEGMASPASAADLIPGLERAAEICEREWQETSSLALSKTAGNLARRIRAEIERLRA